MALLAPGCLLVSSHYLWQQPGARLPGSAECCRAGRRQEAGGRPGRQGVKELDKEIPSAECKKQGSERGELLFLTLAVGWSQGRTRRQEDGDRRTRSEDFQDQS